MLVDAVSRIIPNQSRGNPNQSSSQRSVTISSSVTAGEIFHRKPFAFSAILGQQLRKDASGGDEVLAKYAEECRMVPVRNA